LRGPLYHSHSKRETGGVDSDDFRWTTGRLITVPMRRGIRQNPLAAELG